MARAPTRPAWSPCATESGQSVSSSRKDAFAAHYKAPPGRPRPRSTSATRPTRPATRRQRDGLGAIKTSLSGSCPPSDAQHRRERGSDALEVVMSSSLDRSGSMLTNGGWSALAPAVEDFIERSTTTRQVRDGTFATTVKTDVSMRNDFIDKSAEGTGQFLGLEGSPQLGAGSRRATRDQEHRDTGGQNVTKVALFFTTARQTFQYSRSCWVLGPLQQVSLSRPTHRSTYGLYKIDDDIDDYCTSSSAPPSCCSGFTSFTSVAGGTRA